MITVNGLEIAVRAIIERPLTLRLYINDARDNDELVEASGAGYAAEALNPQTWSTHKSGRGVIAQYNPVTFRFTGEMGKVYGSYVTDADGKVIERQPGPEPFEVKRDGDEITIEPRIGFTR